MKQSQTRHSQKNNRKIYSPVNGRAIPLSDLKDPVFAQKLLGEGVAFVFEEDIIVSPCHGTLVMISHDRHCVGIESESGDQILVHIGLEEENVHGQGYHILVSRGQKIKTGQPIMKLDRKLLESLNIDLTLALIVTNRAPDLFHVHHSDKAVAGRLVVMERA